MIGARPEPAMYRGMMWPPASRDISYNGPIVIESFSVEVQVIARAAAIWRPLAPSQDQLARDGLRFLKELLKG